MQEEFGGRGRDRTGDPLLAKIGRTKNQQLTGAAMNCRELRHLAALTALSTVCVAAHRNSSGLVVGTKLGTLAGRF